MEPQGTTPHARRDRPDRPGRTWRATRHAAAGLLLTVPALLAACTAADVPVPVGTTTVPSVTTSTPTPEPAPTPLAFPTPDPAIAEPTPEGAIAAGTQFLALYDYAFSTGDAAPLLEMSAEGCVTCAVISDDVKAMTDDGSTAVSDPLRVVMSDSAEIREDEWFRVHLRVEQGVVETVTRDGSRQRTSEGGTVDFIFAMAWLGDRWRVEALDLVEITA